MTTLLAKTADRFAEATLALYADEGTFATGVDNEEDMEVVAQAFERRGCSVLREPLRLRIKVTPPERALGL